MSDLNVRIEGNAKNATQLNVKARQFEIIVDEPPLFGGTDNGANPVEYLLAAYAGCINVVAHVTAKELGIEVKNLKIKISGDLNPAKFVGQSDAERAGFKNIDVLFEPESNASSELTEEWIRQIKNRCPINDNLANPTPLSFQLQTEIQTA